MAPHQFTCFTCKLKGMTASRKKGFSNGIQKQKKHWEYAVKLQLFLMPLCPRVAGLYAAEALDMGP